MKNKEICRKKSQKRSKRRWRLQYKKNKDANDTI